MRNLNMRLFVLYVCVLVLAQGILYAQNTTQTLSTNSLQLTMNSQTETTNLQNIWQTLDELLTELSHEALLQSEDLQRLSQVLEQSKTEINELKSLLLQSKQQLDNLETSLQKEQKSRKQWETVAKIEFGIIIGLTLFGIVGWLF